MARAGYAIKKVVVQWHNRDQSETKKQKGALRQYIDESIEMLKEILRVNRNQWQGLYDE